MRSALEHVGLSFPDENCEVPGSKAADAQAGVSSRGLVGAGWWIPFSEWKLWAVSRLLICLRTGCFLPVCNSVLWRFSLSQLIGSVWSWTFFFWGPSPIRPQMAPLVIWLTPASLLSKQEDYRTIEIKQRAKYDGEPGTGQGLSLMGLLHPFRWIMHELAWSCQPSWSASSYGSSDPNKEGTAVASWLSPQQAGCLTSVFEKPYWSWAGIPWNCLLPATSSFVNPS